MSKPDMSRTVMPNLEYVRMAAFAKNLFLGYALEKAYLMAFPDCPADKAKGKAEYLVKYWGVRKEINRLKRAAADGAITTVARRKTILSKYEELAEKILTAETVTPELGLKAIDVHNKMDRLYQGDGAPRERTQINIIVQSPEAQRMLQRVLRGERTGIQAPGTIDVEVNKEIEDDGDNG